MQMLKSTHGPLPIPNSAEYRETILVNNKLTTTGKRARPIAYNEYEKRKSPNVMEHTDMPKKYPQPPKKKKSPFRLVIICVPLKKEHNFIKSRWKDHEDSRKIQKKKKKRVIFINSFSQENVNPSTLLAYTRVSILLYFSSFSRYENPHKQEIKPGTPKIERK